jgi:hypothetical protein
MFLAEVTPAEVMAWGDAFSYVLKSLAAVGGMGALTGVIAIFKRQTKTVTALTPNHGSSLADSIHRTEKMISDLVTADEKFDARISNLEEVVTAPKWEPVSTGTR